MVLVVLLCVGCGGGGGSTTDTGSETADVPGDVPPDGGPDVVDGDVEDVDGGTDVADAETDEEADVGDAPEDAGADLPEASKRSVLAPTSGGGTARRGSYSLTLTIGTPQPMGRGASAGYRGTLGPGAVLGQ
jgi:hypothetical protein